MCRFVVSVGRRVVWSVDTSTFTFTLTFTSSFTFGRRRVIGTGVVPTCEFPKFGPIGHLTGFFRETVFTCTKQLQKHLNVAFEFAQAIRRILVMLYPPCSASEGFQ